MVTAPPARTRLPADDGVTRRQSTETKASVKTTELIVATTRDGRLTG